jgi:hypothetical protein
MYSNRAGDQALANQRTNTLSPTPIKPVYEDAASAPVSIYQADPQTDTVAEPESLLALIQLEESYHLIIPATENQDEVHVYSMIGQSAYGPDKRTTINTVIPIGPIQLVLQGYVDFIGLDVDIKVYVKLPIGPRLKIGEFKGNLRDGITIRVGAGNIIKGSLTLFVQTYQGRRWVSIRGELIVYGKKFGFEARIIPFPFSVLL